MLKDLNPQKALIFRITHRDNVPWVLDNGLHCASSAAVDPSFVPIGNPDLIDKRREHPVPCSLGGALKDYVPFYFTPLSPMFLNIKTGWNGIKKRGNGEIVILVSSLYKLQEMGILFVFTDRHAYLAAAQVFSDLLHLDQIDWSVLQGRDFKTDPDDPTKRERYEAEALVHKHMPVSALLAACRTGALIVRGAVSLAANRGESPELNHDVGELCRGRAGIAGWRHASVRAQPGLSANILLMFQAMVTRLHSPRTLSSPRSRN